MRRMTAGDGYKYLLKSVVYGDGDGDRALSTPLTRYYGEPGTPPGRWLGTGLHGLSGGQIAVGDQVTETQLHLLLGMGRNPLNGGPLGRPYSRFKTAAGIDARKASAVNSVDLMMSSGRKYGLLF